MELIEELVKVFKEETKKQVDTLEEVLDYKIDVYYKKNNQEKGYHSVDACIYFRNYIVKFEYKINVSMLIPKSVLELRFMFENGNFPVEYSIYDILQVLNNEDFNCYTIPYITTKTQMEDALKYLMDAFKMYKEKIDNLAVDNQKLKIIEDNMVKNVYTLLNEKVFELRDVNIMTRLLELYYTIDISRFTTNVYMLFLKGRYKKALKKYNKLKNKTTIYEQGLIKYLDKIITSNSSCDVLPQSLNTLITATKFKSPKTEILPMYLSWVILTPIWGILYSLLFIITRFFLERGSIYYAGADVFYIFLPSFMSAIASSYFTRNITLKFCYKKEYNSIKALDQIENTAATKMFMVKFLQFIIAVSIVFVLLLANTTISFYENTFVDNTDFLNIRGEVFEYNDIKCMYEAEGFLNGFNKVVNDKTCVIILKDDTQINLYDLLEYDKIESNIIPIMKEKQVEIRHIDLVDNIEKDLNIK